MDKITKPNYDTKIDRLNALRQLLSKELPLKKGVNDSLKSQLNAEFKAWISGEIDKTLGNNTGEVKQQNSLNGLSQDDVDIVKAFVEQLKNRAQGNRPPATPNRNARPLKTDPVKQTKDMNDRVLDELERMEKAGPEY